MRRDEIINGYRILQDFTSAGGGLSKWTFAEKGGKEFFIKEFLHPTWPLPGAPGSERTKLRKKKECEVFEDHQRALMDAINSSHIPGGNLISTLDFFRWGAKYFKVTDKVDVTTLKPAEIGKLDLSHRILIMTTVAHSLRILHKLDIVHGDLKIDNVLIKKTRMGSFASKLIDFDSSYFSAKPPEMRENVVGDMVFYSPELSQYIAGHAGTLGEHLTIKSDIFALGLLYSLYLTGKLPPFEREKYRYAWAAVNNGKTIAIADNDELPTDLVALINQMMSRNSDDRPDIDDVFESLKALVRKPEIKSAPKTKTEKKKTPEAKNPTDLKGKMVGKEKKPKVERPATPPESSKLKGTLLWKKKD